jgi:hypothetical protein
MEKKIAFSRNTENKKLEKKKSLNNKNFANRKLKKCIFFFETFLTQNFEKCFILKTMLKTILQFLLLHFRWYASHSFQYQSLYSTLCENPRKPTCDFRRVALDHPIGN